MTLNEYITQSSTRPNRACLEALGASEELIAYLIETPENTNSNVVESRFIEKDYDHPELGELMYYGSASNSIIFDGNTQEYDPGLQEKYREPSEWGRIMGETPCYSIIGVFNGQIIQAKTESSDYLTDLIFESYLTISFPIDEETGEYSIMTSTLTGASHYAIYYCEDFDDDKYYPTLGKIYYAGSLQNGEIISEVTKEYDQGAIVTNADYWQYAINAAIEDTYSIEDIYPMHLVSNGNVILATPGKSEREISFNETTLSYRNDFESGEPIITISNAPKHYAIYSKYNAN